MYEFNNHFVEINNSHRSPEDLLESIPTNSNKIEQTINSLILKLEKIS